VVNWLRTVFSVKPRASANYFTVRLERRSNQRILPRVVVKKPLFQSTEVIGQLSPCKLLILTSAMTLQTVVLELVFVGVARNVPVRISINFLC
jgi:hypothetical protein